MRPLFGIALKLLSTLTFVAMASGVRLVDAAVPTGEVLFFRSFFALGPVLAWIAWRGELATGLKTRNFAGHLLRSVLGLTAMSLVFLSLRNLPLAEATAIGYAAPIITVALAALVLGERVRAARWSAVAVGFAGVLTILAPHLDGIGRLWEEQAAFGAVAAFSGACFVAITMIVVRRLTATETTAAIVLYFSINCSLISFLTLPLWLWPTGRDLVLLVAIGTLGGIGQLLLTESYRWAEASTIAPLEYFSMIWALALGFGLFGEIPSPSVLAGAAIVVSAGLVVAWRERRIGLARRE